MSKSKLPSTENDVKALTKKWFDDHGGYSFAVAASHGMGQHGIADRVGCIPVVVTQEMVGKTIGLFVAAEVKRPGRRGEKLAGATKAQVDFLAGVIHHGGVGSLVDCIPDLDRLHDVLTELRYNNTYDHTQRLASALATRISGNE